MDSALTPHVRGRKQVNLDNRPSDRFGPSPQCPEYTDVVGDMLDGTLRDDQVGVLEGLWRDILCRRLAEGAAGPVRSPAIAGTRNDDSVARKAAETLFVVIEITAIATAVYELVQPALPSAKGFPVKPDPEPIGPYP